MRKWVRRGCTGVVVGVALLLLSACGSSSSGESAEEKESRYFEIFDTAFPGVEDSEKVRAATNVCEMFDAGGRWSDVEQIIIEPIILEGAHALDDDLMRLVIATGVMTYCPEYVPLLPDL